MALESELGEILADLIRLKATTSTRFEIATERIGQNTIQKLDRLVSLGLASTHGKTVVTKETIYAPTSKARPYLQKFMTLNQERDELLRKRRELKEELRNVENTLKSVAIDFRKARAEALIRMMNIEPELWNKQLRDEIRNLASGETRDAQNYIIEIKIKHEPLEFDGGGDGDDKD